MPCGRNGYECFNQEGKRTNSVFGCTHFSVRTIALIKSYMKIIRSFGSCI